MGMEQEGRTRAIMEDFPTRLSPIKRTAWVFILGLLSQRFGSLKSKTTGDVEVWQFALNRRFRLILSFFVAVEFLKSQVEKSSCFISVAQIAPRCLRLRRSLTCEL